MYEPERLKALEELMIEVLRAHPDALAGIAARAGEPETILNDADHDTEFARALREHRSAVRAAKRQLVRRALHPDGGPPADDVDDSAAVDRQDLFA